MSKNPRILITPLNWGLGHASRCVPIVRALRDTGVLVLVGGDEQILSFLHSEISDLETVDLPSWSVTYPKSGSFSKHFLKSFPSMYGFLKKEHALLQGLLKKMDVDAIISDNRYGVYNEQIPSVLISHQLSIQSGIAKPIMDRFLARQINRFSECWVPDNDKHELSGALSINKHVKIPIRYMGALSRFDGIQKDPSNEYSVVAVLSGPEPHRSSFESRLQEQLSTIDGKHLIIRGANGKQMDHSDRIEWRSFASSNELRKAFQNSQYVVSRMGYSSLMDAEHLKIPWLMVPTPGQTEQEYLAELHRGHECIAIQQEKELDVAAFMGLGLNPGQKKEGEIKSPPLQKFVQDFVNRL